MNSPSVEASGRWVALLIRWIQPAGQIPSRVSATSPLPAKAKAHRLSSVGFLKLPDVDSNHGHGD